MSKLTKLEQLQTVVTRIKTFVDDAVSEVNSNLSTLKKTVESDYVKVESVIDNCTSTSTTDPLSANQGKVLLAQIGEVESKINVLTDTETETEYTLSVENGILCLDDGED